MFLTVLLFFNSKSRLWRTAFWVRGCWWDSLRSENWRRFKSI